MRWLFALYVAIVGFAMTAMSALAQEDDALAAAPTDPESPVSSSIIDGVLLLSNEALILTALSFVSSILTSVFLRNDWSDDIKAAVYAVVSFGLALVYTLIGSDDFAAEDIGRRFLLAFVVGTIFYQMLKGPMQTFTTRTDSLLGRTSP